MANEPVTTVTGNLTAEPELRFTPNRPVPCQNSFMVLNWPFATAKPLSGIR